MLHRLASFFLLPLWWWVIFFNVLANRFYYAFVTMAPQIFLLTAQARSRSTRTTARQANVGAAKRLKRVVIASDSEDSGKASLLPHFSSPHPTPSLFLSLPLPPLSSSTPPPPPPPPVNALHHCQNVCVRFVISVFLQTVTRHQPKTNQRKAMVALAKKKSSPMSRKAKKRCVWSTDFCVKLFEVTNTTWENLQIAKHKSIQCTDWMTLICALRFADFLRLCLSPRTTSRTISFSISNSFCYYQCSCCSWNLQTVFFLLSQTPSREAKASSCHAAQDSWWKTLVDQLCIDATHSSFEHRCGVQLGWYSDRWEKNTRLKEVQ